MEKNINIQEDPFIFSFKKQTQETKIIINISYLTMVLIKMRLLMFLVLSQYGLACKYGIIFQTAIHKWMQNWIFRYLP